jgi:pyruvate kinase
MLLTNQRDAARRYALLWGAHCVHTSDVSSTQEMVEKACRIAVIEGIAAGGDQLVITAGVPFGTPGRTNLLRIAWVDS